MITHHQGENSRINNSCNHREATGAIMWSVQLKTTTAQAGKWFKEFIPFYFHHAFCSLSSYGCGEAYSPVKLLSFSVPLSTLPFLYGCRDLIRNKNQILHLCFPMSSLVTVQSNGNHKNFHGTLKLWSQCFKSQAVLISS